MAVRTPVKLDGSGNIVAMDATDISNIQAEVIRLYGLNPSVDLTVVGSGGNLGTINDTRYLAGAALTSVTNYPAETTTAEPSQTTIGYARISETLETVSAPVDTSNIAFPVYLTAANQLQAMSLVDLYDTFISPAITTLTTAGATTAQAGTYTIHTSTTLTGATLVSATPVFQDTRADLTLYTAAGIGEALDQPITITSYYLFQINPAVAVPLPVPVFVTGSSHIQQYTDAAFRAILQSAVRYYATQPGSLIDYTLSTSAVGARGSGMVNTDHTGVTGNYQILFVNANDYRSQEFPNGTPGTITTTYLNCVRG